MNVQEPPIDHLTQEMVANLVCDCTGASKVTRVQPMQTLWSGQGYILRVYTEGTGSRSVVVKYIAPVNTTAHPRGWNTQASFQRKMRSYEIECHWYQHYAACCPEQCTVPALLALHTEEQRRILVLEDLSVDYPVLRSQLSVNEVSVCLSWLARFHATFLNVAAEGLWPEGCYWHLATRQDEYNKMQAGAIKEQAHRLDQCLRQARFQTLVHGDAKVANFCFDNDVKHVAAVDFQYVGAGCGIRDVVYLLGSCLSEHDCQQHEVQLLDCYFEKLRQALSQRDELAQGDQQNDNKINASGFASEIEAEWRSLYAIAWTDFYRFLLGWMPEHAKINRYTKLQASRALAQLRSSQ